MVDSIREKTLRFFKADPEYFDLVFTANATAAIKLVGECFRDLAEQSSTSGKFWYGYHKDAHTSIVGVREFSKGNHHCFTSDQEVEKWLAEGSSIPSRSSDDGFTPGLFAYPGQSNMTGRRLPLSWCKKLRASTSPALQNTYSILDAAALATTTQVDLSDHEAAPDFTAVSFYKIFGFPDLGALIVRRRSGHILSWRHFFGGGTVNGLTVLHDAYVIRKDASIHEFLEDGTLPFHSILALGCAIDVHKELYGSMKAISRHTLFLARRLYTGMSNLRHLNGRPICSIYIDDTGIPYTDPAKQGATIAFNVMAADGHYIGWKTVEELANNNKIYLRAGGLCNPGGIAGYLKIEPWQFKRAWSAGYHCGDGGELQVINGKPTGVIRASLGAMNTVSDVDTLIAFLAATFVAKAPVKSAGQSLAALKFSPITPTSEFQLPRLEFPRGSSVPDEQMVAGERANELLRSVEKPASQVRLQHIPRKPYHTRVNISDATTCVDNGGPSPNGTSNSADSKLSVEEHPWVYRKFIAKEDLSSLSEAKLGARKKKRDIFKFWKSSKGVAKI